MMIVESLDAGLVRWGTPLPFPTPLRCVLKSMLRPCFRSIFRLKIDSRSRGNVSLEEGASFVLFDNVSPQAICSSL